MCFTTVVSTTSDMDLSQFNTRLIQFSRQLPGIPEEAHLRYSTKWHLKSQYGCSCGFRHLGQGDDDLGFSEPLDWMPEDPEDVEATHQVVNIFRNLAREGARLDCIDAWTHNDEEEAVSIKELAVNLAAIPDSGFRFFSGFRFEFNYAT